jgi:hypothetical protein
VQVVWLRNASDVQLFGYGGNACPMKSYPSGFADYPTSLFRVEGSTNISLVSLTSYEMGKNDVHFLRFYTKNLFFIKTGSGQT